MKNKYTVGDKIARNDRMMKYTNCHLNWIRVYINNNNVFKQLISNYQLEQFDSL